MLGEGLFAPGLCNSPRGKVAELKKLRRKRAIGKAHWKEWGVKTVNVYWEKESKGIERT